MAYNNPYITGARRIPYIQQIIQAFGHSSPGFVVPPKLSLVPAAIQLHFEAHGITWRYDIVGWLVGENFGPKKLGPKSVSVDFDFIKLHYHIPLEQSG